MGIQCLMFEQHRKKTPNTTLLIIKVKPKCATPTSFELNCQVEDLFHYAILSDDLCWNKGLHGQARWILEGRGWDSHCANF